MGITLEQSNMIMSYDNDNVRLNNLNKVYFCNIKDYYSFLEKLYSEKCTINADIISKKYKIYSSLWCFNLFIRRVILKIMHTVNKNSYLHESKSTNIIK